MYKILALSISAFLWLGCSEDPIYPENVEPLCFDDSQFDGTTPDVSFVNDVLPIFRGSCAFSTCHAVQSADRPYLGSNLHDKAPTPEEIQRIIDQTVGVKSVKASSMDIIKAGDPGKSFLQHKIDHTLMCPLISDCSGSACGSPMPRSSPQLSIEKRDTIRRWITQGAHNDANEAGGAGGHGG